jgi:hypothetical protein
VTITKEAVETETRVTEPNGKPIAVTLFLFKEKDCQNVTAIVNTYPVSSLVQ